MTIYITLFRGMNVGGHNKVKMADLKGMFKSMGFNQVQTYIQSGNVLFSSEETAEPIRQRIEQEITKTFSISSTVILRTSIELKQIIENCPFSEMMINEAKTWTDVETFYVSLLLDRPAQAGIEQLKMYTSENDEFQIRGKEVYLLLREGVRNSRLAKNLFKLDVPSTMRNWKTIKKLNDLTMTMKNS